MELTKGVAYDAGLRNYMTSIYNIMILGILVSAGASWLSIETGLLAVLKGGGILFWVVLLAPFAFIFILSDYERKQKSTLQFFFVALAACEGLSLSVIVSEYAEATVFQAFLSTAVAFAGLSLWGYTTKRDLSGMGSFFLMALIGLIVAMLFNIFFPAPLFTLLVSIAGVLLFAGLIAYDTQTLKNAYVGSGELSEKIAILGALSLYLDFLNMFLFILRILGIGTNRN